METSAVKDAVRSTRRMRPLRFLARAGFAVNGLVHAIIGFLAIGVAIGGGGQADQSGALSQLAAGPGGTLTLWVVTVGLAALGVWLILGAFLMPSADKTKRVAHFLIEAGKGLAYLVLAGTALTFARGGSSNSEADVDRMSAALIAAPGGILVLWLLALLVIGVGVYFVVKGVRRKFVDDIDLPADNAGKGLVALGIFGYVAKGIALGFMGILLALAAYHANPAEAAGLDGSLKALVTLPLGQVVLILIGLGLMAYGAYCFVRAKVARL
jgi:hypothetical protein